jgi:hypothetical protein
LPISAIDFRVQSINNGGYAQILAYKDARVDMQRLDDVVGPLNWQRHHVRENKNCIISIYDAEKKEWVSKEDTGTESNTEAEKGLASDSFKRTGTNWGIGRELYAYPNISIKLLPNEISKDEKTGKYKATFELKLKEWQWHSIFEDGKLVYLGAKDNNGKLRFNHDTRKPKGE